MAIFLHKKINTLYGQQKDLEQAFQPLFYRIYNEKDRAAFSLLLDKPGLLITDYLLSQVKELMKISHPQLKLSSEELEDIALQHIKPLSLEDYGVWVYYPWSNRLVHIVDEKEFIELRTSRNQYKITYEERNLLALKSIGVVGLSVGQSVAITLAMERIAGEIRLADFDVLELTNLNRIRTGIHNIGLLKVYAVAREIAEIDPFIVVKCFSQGITENNMNAFLTETGKLDLVLEESDGFDIKIMIRHKARELGIPVVMESSDKCMVDVERFDLEPSRSILHGLVQTLDIPKLKSLKTNEEKIPYVFDILGIETLSTRLKASMLEVGQTITTWPQLASSVTMGGGITADVSRRILLKQFNSSGRYYVDIDTLISDPPNEEKATAKMESKIEEIKSLIHQLSISETTHSIDDASMRQIAETGIRATAFATSLQWKWISSHQSLYLFQENTNPLISIEEHCTSLIALGAALENISTQAQTFQLSSLVKIFPLSTDHRLLAKITFEPLSKSMESASRNSQTSYNKEKKSTSDTSVLSLVQQAATQIQDIELTSFTNKEQIEQINKILGVCNRLLLLNMAIQYADTSHSSQSKKELLKRIPHELGLHELPLHERMNLEVAIDPSVATLLHNWQKGQVLEQFSTHSSLSPIGLISITSGNPLDFIRAGRAFQKLKLIGIQEGMYLDYIPSFSLLHALLAQQNSTPLSEDLKSQLKKQSENLSAIHANLAKKEGLLMFRFSSMKTEDIVLHQLNNVYCKL